MHKQLEISIGFLCYLGPHVKINVNFKEVQNFFWWLSQLFFLLKI